MLEVGSSLQEARSRRGVALSEAEAATMIRRRYLEALEDERFDLLPAGPYARSFLREYAEFLGLDGDILAAEYDLRFAPQEPPPPEPLTRRSELALLLSDVPIGTVLAAIGVLALVAIGVWQLGRGGSTTTPPASPSSLLAQLPVTSHTTTQPPPHVSKPKVRPVAHPSVFSLTAARGTCWLSVHLGGGSGKTVYEGTLQQGQTVRFGLRSPLWVRVGAPWNVDVTIGNRNVDASLPTQTGNVLVSTRSLQPTLS